MEIKAISEALLAWCNSQQITPAEAVTAMVNIIASSIGSQSDTAEELAERISGVQALLLKTAAQVWQDSHKQ